jgi:hypothetical protein
VPVRAAMAAISRRSLHLLMASSVGGVSAVRMASSPIVVLNVPATALPIAVESLLKPSRSHFWPSQMDSTPYAAVEIGTAHATCLANFLGTPLAVITLEMVLIRCVPNASRCLTWACQLRWQSTRKPSHLTSLARMSKDSPFLFPI